MSYAKLLSAEPETGRILRLNLDDGVTIRIWGTKKQLRKAVAGGDIDKLEIVYNPELRMLEDDWVKIQSVLQDIDFGPLLNQQMKLSHQELGEVPRWGWRGGLQSYGHRRGNLFTYHPIDLFRKRKDRGFEPLYGKPDGKPNDTEGNLYGILRELDFPEVGQMTMWRFWDFDLKTLDYQLEKEKVCPNEYFYA